MKVLAFDIEGNGLNEITISRKGEAIPEATRIWCASTYDIQTGESKGYRPDEIKQLVSELEEADLVVGHNILGYDLPLLNRLYGVQPRNVYDTLVVSRLMWPDKCGLPDGSHSLKSWGKHLGEYKDDYSGGWDTFNEEMLSYCVQDSVVTAKIYEYQKNFAKNFGDSLKMEHRVAEVISEQVENGFGFDMERAKDLEQSLMTQKAETEAYMSNVFPDKVIKRYSEKTGKRLKDKVIQFNPGSRKQIADRLNEKYGWHYPVTDKGNPKVDRSVLSKLDYPEAKMLVDYFDSTKLMSQVTDWIKRAETSRDGRVHGSINTLGTVTGRMTSNNPNMQQVSGDKRARSLFIPRKGWSLVGCDLKGLELRMLAHYLYPYDGGKYAEVVVDGDVHTHNQIAMEVDTRNKAKGGIYCFLYGGGDAKFGSVIGASAKKGREIKNNLLSNIPGLRKLIDICKFNSVQNGEVRPFDWRGIPVRSEHAALNTLLQSSGAHIAKVWTCYADKVLKDRFNGRFAWVANVHDELQIECEKEIAKEVGQEVCRCATLAGKFFNCRVKIEADYRVGNNWSETH